MYGHAEEDEHYDPKDSHHCTDPLCCIIFVVSLVAFGGVYIGALKDGNMSKLYHGIDGNGKVCGVDPEVANEPMLYWCATWSQGFSGAVPAAVNLSNPICVSACPGAAVNGSVDQILAPVPECASVNGESMAYQTIILMDRYCVPDKSVPALESVYNQVITGELDEAITQSTESLSSIPSAWPVLVGAFFVAVVAGYIYLLLLKCCAEPLVWATMIISILSLAAFGTYLWTNAGSMGGSDVPDNMQSHAELGAKIGAVVCWVLAALGVLGICCLCSSIRTAAAVIEVSVEVIWEMPALLVMPVLKAILNGVMAAFLVYGFLMLFTCAPIETYGDGLSRNFKPTGWLLFEIFFYLLIAYWLMAFLKALYEFVVAFAVADYYFTPYDMHGEKDVGHFYVCHGYQLGLITHAGSLAFGSFIIAFICLIQKTLEFIDKEQKAASGGGNAILSCILCCCLCCVSCFKEIIEFINKNAYIDMAVTSNGFCAAARNAMAMIAQLGGTMAILNGATYAFTFFGTALIGVAVGFLTNFVVRQGSFVDQESSYYVADPDMVTLIAIIIGVVVALVFMDLFDMASDTLLYCYGHDLATGSSGYTAPAALKELFHDQDQHLKSQGGH